MIEELREKDTSIKINFQQEFERFQQYLKDQNSRFSKQDQRQREIEKSLKKFNEIGGIEELIKMIQESKDEKAQYAPQMMGTFKGKLETNRGGATGSNLNSTTTNIQNSGSPKGSKMQMYPGMTGVDSKLIK